ncbi:MAG: hypothetical protein R3F56_06660 [Planctomycetota bacterium]
MESILVLPRAHLFSGAWPQGFVAADQPAAAAALRAAGDGFLRPREVAERTPAWKQPIPYCMLVRRGEVFCVERLPRQGEARLHGKLSVGLGGHVEAADLDPEEGPILTALRRELAEEVRLPPAPLPAPRFVGLVNDDSDAVGEVHFGLVFCQHLPDGGSVEILESSKMRGAFRHLAGLSGLWQDSVRFESWSRMLIEAGAVEALANHAPAAPEESCGKTQEEP